MSNSIKSIQLIADPGKAGWVFGKIARRVQRELETRGLNVQIVGKPEGNSDVVFWLYFRTPGILESEMGNYSTRLKSTYVTHVDNSVKLAQIKKLRRAGIDMVFLSPSHSNEISSMLSLANPFASVLLGTDLVEPERKMQMRIGLFSNRYADGRKNEKWLLSLAQEVDLKHCEFVFIGTGWGEIGNILENAGTQVEIYDDVQHPYPSYSDFPLFYDSLDLYLNLGFDEGAMGAIDAYVLGTKLLISRQGYHEDFVLDDSSFFSDYHEFKEKFIAILDAHRTHQENIKKWSWSNCANGLLQHWEEELQLRNTLATSENKEINLPVPTKLNPKYRKLYFVFVKRRAQHFVQLRLKPWLLRKYKRLFQS